MFLSSFSLCDIVTEVLGAIHGLVVVHYDTSHGVECMQANEAKEFRYECDACLLIRHERASSCCIHPDTALGAAKGCFVDLIPVESPATDASSSPPRGSAGSSTMRL